MVGNTAGMFLQRVIDITDKVTFDRENVLAVKVYPVDMPGTIRPKGGKSFGANGEFQNGGNGEIGRNVTQLMTVGWDFFYLDGHPRPQHRHLARHHALHHRARAAGTSVREIRVVETRLRRGAPRPSRSR